MLAAPALALQQLDSVQSLDDLNRFEPADFVQALRSDLGPAVSPARGDGGVLLAQVAAQLDALHQLLLHIEAFARKIMGIRLLHGLAYEPVPPQLRTLLSATVLSYAGDLQPLIRRFERAVSVSALDTIVAAAEAVLALRHELQTAVFTIGQSLATQALPPLAKASESPLLSEAQRTQLQRACLDLHSLGQSPLPLLQAPFFARLKEQKVAAQDLGEVLASRLSELLGPPPSDRDAPSEHGRFALLEID